MHKYKKSLAAAIALITLVAIFTASSCKKNDATADCTNGIMDGNETGIDCGGDCNACVGDYIKTSNIGNKVFTQYFYDAQHRLDSVYDESLPPTNIAPRRTKYTYLAGKVIETNRRDTTVAVTTYYLNSNGYAELVVLSSNDSVRYTYDAEGHVLTESSNPHVTYTWQNGNMETENVDGEIYNYAYITDKRNTISDENKGISFLGKSSVNPYSSYTSSVTNITQFYIYTYDAQNRIKSKARVGFEPTEYTYY